MDGASRQLAAGLAGCGIQAAPEQRGQLLRWLALLERWNRVFNLTAVAPPHRIAQLVLMSAAAIPHLRGSRILDAGSGAGVPGIPLAVLTPERSYTLLDSSGRKARFIRQSRLELRLKNVFVKQARAERFSAERYDTIISRAFADWDGFIAATRHLGGAGTRWLAYKHADAGSEAARCRAGGMVCETHRLAVAGGRCRLLVAWMK